MTDVVAETVYGKVEGETIDSIHWFRGIPYGAPTGGQNRFKPPTPPKPWAGVREATRYGMSCWQPGEANIRTDLLENGIDAMGEDCLVLNVWTRGLNDQGKRPVMVWIHGGGFTNGSGNAMVFYDGAALAKGHDVVVVTVNHRLGVFGYLHLEDVAGEEFAGSGNAGMLDLVAALEWVRDNIASFGGDPGKVMIFGESGGGAKVSTLLAMPAAKGLFHTAAIESGPGLRMRTLEEATSHTRAFLELVGVSPDRIEALQKFRADVLNRAWIEFTKEGTAPGGNQTAPVVDGKILPVHPFDPVPAPSGVDIPVIVGTNKDEQTLFLALNRVTGRPIDYDEETVRKIILSRTRRGSDSSVMAERLDDVIAVYRRTRPGITPSELLIAITTDQMRVASIRLAERKAAAGGAPAYMYLFTWESKASWGRLKSAHTFEIPFVFNNAAMPLRLFRDAPERFRLAAEMSGAWAAFARSGNPDHAGIPHWPAYDAKDRATMIFGKETHVENDPASEERKAWQGII
jgi:para-nitrobenzyl esterase